MNKFQIRAELKYEGGTKYVDLVESEFEHGNPGSVVVAIRDSINKISEIEKTIKEQPDILRELVPEFSKFTVRAIRADGTTIDEIDIAPGEEYQIASRSFAFLCNIFTFE